MDPLDRRAFLLRGGLLAGASSLAGAAGFLAGREATEADVESADSRLFALDDWYVNLTTFLLASHPRVVREAIERHRRGLDSNAAHYLHQFEPTLEQATRDAAAGYL